MKPPADSNCNSTSEVSSNAHVEIEWAAPARVWGDCIVAGMQLKEQLVPYVLVKEGLVSLADCEIMYVLHDMAH